MGDLAREESGWVDGWVSELWGLSWGVRGWMRGGDYMVMEVGGWVSGKEGSREGRKEGRNGRRWRMMVVDGAEIRTYIHTVGTVGTVGM